MKAICLKVPASLNGRISTLATTRMKTRSHLLREAIEQFLAESGNEDDRSFLAQARDLNGVVSGPKDLSYNPDYLEGYGR